MKLFQDRVAVITGGASGIGLALARRAAREGMRLVLADIEAPRLEEARAALGLPPGRLATHVVDVSQEADVQRLADDTFARFGGVHLLCNNAGVGLTRAAWEYTTADWEWVLGVDLWSVIHGIRHFVPRMREQAEDSHIVNTASAAGLVSTPGMAAYNVAKHGVVTLSETLKADLAQVQARIGVSVLCPAWVPTRIAESGRNRPARFADRSTADPLAASMESDKAKAVQSGRQTADDMADAVFEAVATGRHFIVPHRKMNVMIEARAKAILEQQ